MNGPLAVLAGAGVGFGSALVPLLNAEVYAVASATRSHPALAIAVVVALACGQTAGKLALFEAARRGSGRLLRHRNSSGRHRAPSGGRWSRRIARTFASSRTGRPLVLVSAALGLPPLAVVSLAAGASGQRRWEFGLLCLVGRTARFAALALPAAWAFQ